MRALAGSMSAILVLLASGMPGRAEIGVPAAPGGFYISVASGYHHENGSNVAAQGTSLVGPGNGSATGAGTGAAAAGATPGVGTGASAATDAGTATANANATNSSASAGGGAATFANTNTFSNPGVTTGVSSSVGRNGVMSASASSLTGSTASAGGGIATRSTASTTDSISGTTSSATAAGAFGASATAAANLSGTTSTGQAGGPGASINTSAATTTTASSAAAAGSSGASTATASDAISSTAAAQGSGAGSAASANAATATTSSSATASGSTGAFTTASAGQAGSSATAGSIGAGATANAIAANATSTTTSSSDGGSFIKAQSGAFGDVEIGYVLPAPLYKAVTRFEVYATGSMASQNNPVPAGFGFRGVDNNSAVAVAATPFGSLAGSVSQRDNLGEIGLRIKADRRVGPVFMALSAEPFYLDFRQFTTSFAGAGNTFGQRTSNVHGQLYGGQAAVEAVLPVLSRVSLVGRLSVGGYSLQSSGAFNSLITTAAGGPLAGAISDGQSRTGARFGAQGGVRYAITPTAWVTVLAAVDHLTDVPTAVLPRFAGDKAAYVASRSYTDFRVGARLTVALLGVP